MYQELYSRFLASRPGIQHFACHSHHYWPDVTREATIQYWEDSARYADDKWALIYGEKIPQTQRLVARNLGVDRADRIVFAPSTHELAFRLLSCLDFAKPIKILTTDSEFYSFDRQVNRMSELANVEIEKVPVDDFEGFSARFEKRLREWKPDFVFFSHVFFNSGLVSEARRLSGLAAANGALTVVDGYHGFMAVPTDLSKWDPRVFYLSGSYKYAQGGEGACFLVVPDGDRHRPLYTGWFAEVTKLDRFDPRVGYPHDGSRFAGSTMDFTALYRLHAVLSLFQDRGITVPKIHAHIQSQQNYFLRAIDEIQHPLVNRQRLLLADADKHGHFFTFVLPSAEETDRVQKALRQRGIQTDSRKDRLRFGFGLYHEGPYDLRALREI